MRLFALCQIVFGDHLLGQAAAHAFGQEHIFAMQLHSGLIAVPLGASALDAEFARNHAFDFAILAVDQL